jgi:hypothetical protein
MFPGAGRQAVTPEPDVFAPNFRESLTALDAVTHPVEHRHDSHDCLHSEQSTPIGYTLCSD